MTLAENNRSKITQYALAVDMAERGEYKTSMPSSRSIA
jgi:hypothetical protein